MLIQSLQTNQVPGNDDSYRNGLRQKSKIFLVIAASGLIMAALSLSCTLLGVFPLEESTADLYMGFGLGLLIVGILKYIQNRRLLGNDELCRRARLKNQDERNLAIASKAQSMTVFVLLLSCYAIMLIGGMFNILIFWCFWLIIIIYTLSYCLFIAYYRNKM